MSACASPTSSVGDADKRGGGSGDADEDEDADAEAVNGDTEAVGERAPRSAALGGRAN